MKTSFINLRDVSFVPGRLESFEQGEFRDKVLMGCSGKMHLRRKDLKNSSSVLGFRKYGEPKAGVTNALNSVSL